MNSEYEYGGIMFTDNNDLYQDKIVAFIDILGFREKVVKSEGNQDLQKSIYAILKFFDDLKKKYEKFCVQISNFSDSIIISLPVRLHNKVLFGVENNLLTLTNIIIMINNVITSHEFIIRGGISVGKLVHNNEVCFGNALNNAYELEKDIAKFPRVVITLNTFEKMKNEFTFPEDGLDAKELDEQNKC